MLSEYELEIVQNSSIPLEIIDYSDFHDLNNREDIIAWVVHPCPNFTIDSQVLEYIPNLSLICTPSTGTTHLNKESLTDANIEVIGLKGSTTVEEIKASSEFTFIHVLNAIRKFTDAVDHTKNGNWRNGDSLLRGREVCESSIGIVGLGRIGGNVAKWSRCMGMAVSYVDPNVSNENYKRFHSLKEMASEVDVLVVAVHLDSSTEGMIDSSILKEMKEDSWLVNTSRGEILVENDLLEILRKGLIRGASLDVLCFENREDFPSCNQLYKYSLTNDNLIITPHVAGLSYDSERKAQMFAFENALRFVNER